MILEPACFSPISSVNPPVAPAPSIGFSTARGVALGDPWFRSAVDVPVPHLSPTTPKPPASYAGAGQ